MCLEQAACLAAKYPNDPGCKNIMQKLPEDMQPREKIQSEKNGFKKLFHKILKK